MPGLRHRIGSIVGVSFVLMTLTAPLTPPAGASVGMLFNADGITIPDGPDGAGDPYPSPLTISFGCGVTNDVDVILSGVTHGTSDDFDILLVGPGGQNAIIMSDAGGDDALADEDFTLDDQAAAPLPDSTPITPDTSYQPANHGAGDPFPGPAPSPTGGTALSVFNGTNPNGTWNLYVLDDQATDTGSIDAWGLLINSSRTSEICIPGAAESLGRAAPYPHLVTASGHPGSVTDVNLTFTGFSHQRPEHLDLLLVGPQGQNAIVMSDAGADVAVSNITFGLDDEASAPLPGVGLVGGSTYQPANRPSSPDPDSWDAPAPVPLGGSALSVFDGTNPNGTWSLFAMDDQIGSVGRIDDWSLQITAPGPPPTIKGGKAKEGKSITFRVGLSSAALASYSIPFATVRGSAKAGKDFKKVSGNVDFAAGQTTATVVVKTKNDPKDEKKETFSVQLTTPAGPISATGKIKDNDK